MGHVEHMEKHVGRLLPTTITEGERKKSFKEKLLEEMFNRVPITTLTTL